MQRFDVAVIGQGYAGLIAAKLANEKGLRTASFEAVCMGGLILNLNELEPAPGGTNESGAELASELAMANMENGVECISETVLSMTPDKDGLWRITTGEDSYLTRNIVTASGAKLRKLGIPGEVEYFGKGISECADCDGPLYSGMDTVVVGGGNSAFQEALALTKFAGNVTILMRSDAPTARADLQERAVANPNIKQVFHAQVKEILGQPGKGVSGIRVEIAGDGERILSCQGVFIFIGLEPNTDFVIAAAPRDHVGALITDERGSTGISGLWAIGAVRSGFGGSLDNAAEDAARTIAAIT